MSVSGSSVKLIVVPSSTLGETVMGLLLEFVNLSLLELKLPLCLLLSEFYIFLSDALGDVTLVFSCSWFLAKWWDILFPAPLGVTKAYTFLEGDEALATS